MMNSLKRIGYVVGGLALASSALLAGCGGNIGLKIRSAVVIESAPPGAQVWVAGRAVGVTPLTLELDKNFPRRWTARVKSDEEGFAFYRRLETVDIKKDGCEPYMQQLVEADLARDIKVTLKCDPNYQPASIAAPAVAPAPVPVVGIEQRLRTVEDLKTKGLITDDEYRAQRQRILNGL